MDFLKATSEDPSLREAICSIISVGDGDISSAEELDGDEAQALRGEKGVRVAALAAEQGYTFTLGQLNTVVSVFDQYRSGNMSEEDFAKAMGTEVPLDSSPGKLESVGDTVTMIFLGNKYQTGKQKSHAFQVLDFMKKTSEDAALRDELKHILEVGDGDIGDFSQLDADEANALKSGRGVLVAEYAAKHGYYFTLSDLLAVTDAFERVQAEELSVEDFERFLDVKVEGSDFFPLIASVASMTYKGFKYASPVVANVKDNTLPVVRFLERTGSDAALSEKLMAIIGGDGDISAPGEIDSEEAGSIKGEASSQIVSLGAEHGYRFTVSDLSAVISAFQLVSEGTLGMESCARILGMGKAEAANADIKKTAGLIYRGVRY
jgi:hypothetical protein